MLKLTKRKGSPNWYARGTELGFAIEQSLGTSDRGQALALLAKLRAEIFEKHLRGGAAPGSEGFATAALRYMESGSERRYVAPLLRHFADKPIDQIDQQAIDRAAQALYPKCGPATRNRCVHTPLSAILKFAGVALDIRRPSRGIVRWLTHDEAGRLLAACAPHLRPLVMFLLLTGARIGEALWLDWRCVDLARAHVSFPKTKNGHPRGVPLHRDVVAHWRTCRAETAACSAGRTASPIGGHAGIMSNRRAGSLRRPSRPL